MATTITSLANNTVSTYPTDSNVKIYATGNTTLRLFSDEGTLSINGGEELDCNPAIDIVYNASSFPSGFNVQFTAYTPSENYNLTLSVTGVESEDLPIVWPSGFTGGVKSFPANTTVEDIVFSIEGYEITPVGYSSILMDSNKTLTFTTVKIPETVVAPNFRTSDGDFTSSGAGQLTTTTSNVRAVVNSIADGDNPSTLPVTSIEASWHSSWLDVNPDLGLAIENTGVNRNDMEAWLQYENSGVNYGAPSQVSLGYNLPQSTTSKLKVEAVDDGGFWRFNFLSSTDSGSTFFSRASVLSTIASTTPLYGNIFQDASGVQYNNVKVLIAI